MKKISCISLISLSLCAILPSCRQSSKSAEISVTDIEDTISIIENTVSIIDDSLSIHKDYVDGYLFIDDVICDGCDDGYRPERISAGTFCLDNYEFPITNCNYCLLDSNDVLYYCPPTQDDIYIHGYLTKEKFASSTRPVRGYFNAPETWLDGQEHLFVSKSPMNEVFVKKIRINDPDAVLILEEGKREPLYGKYAYTLRGFVEGIFCQGSIVVLNDYYQQNNYNHSLTLSDSGHFNVVNDATNDVQQTSIVMKYLDLPEFTYLYFIEDSIITIDCEAFYMVK